MKQLTSYNRVAGYLNKIFDLLNAEYFESNRELVEKIVARIVEKIKAKRSQQA